MIVDNGKLIISRILEKYEHSVYHFTENFIRVIFYFRETLESTPQATPQATMQVTMQAEKVLGELASVCELGIYRVPIPRLPGLTDYRSIQKIYHPP